jgi:hypothetical protein
VRSQAKYYCIQDNLRKCYRELVSRGWVSEHELSLLDAWLEDFSSMALA